MHRFNIAHDLLEAALARGGGAAAELAALAVWLRLSAGRLLTWNRAYNVKPREISAAQARPARPARHRCRRVFACRAAAVFCSCALRTASSGLGALLRAEQRERGPQACRRKAMPGRRAACRRRRSRGAGLPPARVAAHAAPP